MLRKNVNCKAELWQVTTHFKADDMHKEKMAGRKGFNETEQRKDTKHQCKRLTS